MNTLFDRNTREDQERELHNSMIAERYKVMLGVVDGQFDEKAPVVNATQTYAPTMEPSISAPSYTAPTTEHVPQVTEYTPNTSLFTAETLDRIAAQHAVDTFAPTYVAPQPVVAPIVEEEVASVREVSYSLTPAAKRVLAIFGAVIVIMLAMIGANTQTIHRKTLRLRNLEEKKEELIERNEEIQRYIEELQTEESIIKRATEAGLLN